MAKHRIVDPTGFYHLCSRGNFGRTLYEESVHRQIFLRLYDRVTRDHGWITLAYCLMTNHYHFVIRLTDDLLSKGMQQLNGGFSRRMNAIAGRTGAGHLFKNRFHSEPIERDAHLLEACRYTVLNPVRAGLCERAEEWEWSSYRACAGIEAPLRFLAVDDLLGLFGTQRDFSREVYFRFVLAGQVLWSDQGDGGVTKV